MTTADVRGVSASKGRPLQGTLPDVPLTGKTWRGTSNGNARGGSDERRRRREWLVQTYRADRDVLMVGLHHGPLAVEVERGTEGAEPACRCYRCGRLLTTQNVTADRIVPGCLGGTYKRENIRPSCQGCASHTGAVLGNQRKKLKR